MRDTNAILKVQGMSCAHCKRAVENAVGVLPGVSSVEADVKKGEVKVNFNPVETDLDAIRQAIEGQGYSVV